MKRFFTGYICGILTCALIYIAIYYYSNIDTDIKPRTLSEQETEVSRKIDSLRIKEMTLEKQKAFFDSVLNKHMMERMK